jgi:hypothetical protein
VILKQHATAFINRFKRAMTSSGIKKGDPTKRLLIVRFSLPPTGKASNNIVSEFINNDGITVCPTDNDIATLKAIKTVAYEFPQTWPSWAHAYRPTAGLSFAEKHLGWLVGKTS